MQHYFSEAFFSFFFFSFFFFFFSSALYHESYCMTTVICHVIKRTPGRLMIGRATGNANVICPFRQSYINNNHSVINSMYRKSGPSTWSCMVIDWSTLRETGVVQAILFRVHCVVHCHSISLCRAQLVRA